MAESLEVYAFADRRDEDRLLPVRDVGGTVVARIRRSFWTRDFSATDADGAPLCAGRTRVFSGDYVVADGNGRTLLDLRKSFWNTRRRRVQLADGTGYTMRGDRWPGRGWSVTDATGAVALRIVATSSWLSFHPDDVAVEVGDHRLTLAHVVGIVEANRQLMKAARAAD